jgi:hypothetical protein
MQIQLHLNADASGYQIDGAPPWADEDGMKQWGDHVEGVLRKHSVASGVHLIFSQDGRIKAEYCGDKGVTAEINTEVNQFTNTLIEALLTDPETAESCKPEDLIIGIVFAG